MAGGVRERALNAGRAHGPRRGGALAGALALGARGLTRGAHAAADPARVMDLFDWQPGRGLREPWRAFTAAGVHRSLPHLAGNLLATGLVAWLGLRLRNRRP